MWLVDKIKKMFKKEIKINEKDRGKIVSLVKLKNGVIKLGSDIRVEEDYNAAIVYYNHVCDILVPGIHTFSENTIPKVYMLYYKSVRKDGVSMPDSVRNADLYFVNLNEFDELKFRTTQKTTSKTNGIKSKIKIFGKYTIKVSDTEKFMSFLSKQYAIVQNKKVFSEVTFIANEKINSILAKASFSFETFFLKKEELKAFLLSNLKAEIEGFGFTITDIEILDIEVPKKMLTLKLSLEGNQKLEVEGEPVLKRESVEEDLIEPAATENNINENGDKQTISSNNSVFSENKNETSFETPSQESKLEEDDKIVNIDNLYKEFQKQEENINKNNQTNFQESSSSYVNQPSPDIVLNKQKQEKIRKDFKDFNLHREGYSNLYNTVDDYVISDAPQKNPSLFAESKEKSESEEKEEIEEKPRRLITCACCGAKNYEGEKVCCVCGSTL